MRINDHITPDGTMREPTKEETDRIEKMLHEKGYMEGHKLVAKELEELVDQVGLLSLNAVKRLSNQKVAGEMIAGLLVVAHAKTLQKTIWCSMPEVIRENALENAVAMIKTPLKRKPENA